MTSAPRITRDVGPGDAVQLRRKLDPNDLAKGIIGSQQQRAAFARTHINEGEALKVQMQPLLHRTHDRVKHRWRDGKVTVVVDIVLVAGGQLVDQPAGLHAEALIEGMHGAIAAVFALLHARPRGLLLLRSFRHSRPISSLIR